MLQPVWAKAASPNAPIRKMRSANDMSGLLSRGTFWESVEYVKRDVFERGPPRVDWAPAISDRGNPRKVGHSNERRPRESQPDPGLERPYSNCLNPCQARTRRKIHLSQPTKMPRQTAQPGHFGGKAD